MEQKGSKRVELAGLNDKCQKIAVFCATPADEFLPVQLIYQGKTTASLSRFAFPDDWDITFTPNHWSNEDKTKEYINNIIIPYIQRKRKELKLSPSHPALSIYDEFKGQLTPDIFSLLEANQVFVVKKFQNWYWKAFVAQMEVSLLGSTHEQAKTTWSRLACESTSVLTK